MTKTVKIFAVAIVAVVAGVTVYNATNDSKFTDLQNDNLEALAKDSPENDKIVAFDGTKESPWPKVNKSGSYECSGVNGDCHF